MIITVGTFNLNNLFSRFNFSGAIEALVSGKSTSAMSFSYEFSEHDIKVRTSLGKLVKGKPVKDTLQVAERISRIDLDVLAVQEVEDIDVLKSFNKEHLNGVYPHVVLIEGNDPRFIDIALLSKYPLGAITSFQTAVHRDNPQERVFSRDLLEVEILDKSRSKKLFTIYNNHLKSHFGDEISQKETASNALRRKQQAETISEIVSKRMRVDEKFLITGDMNDGIDASPLAPLLSINNQLLFNGLSNPEETRSAKPETDGFTPKNKAWTHRYKVSGKSPEYYLFDQIWLSPGLQPHFQKGWIDRRTKHGGDGSDHDPAWVELAM